MTTDYDRGFAAGVEAAAEAARFMPDKLAIRALLPSAPGPGPDAGYIVMSRDEVLAAMRGYSPAPRSSAEDAACTWQDGVVCPLPVGVNVRCPDACPMIPARAPSTGGICPECGGSGAAYSSYEPYYVTCPRCHGTGRASPEGGR